MGVLGFSARPPLFGCISLITACLKSPDLRVQLLIHTVFFLWLVSFSIQITHSTGDTVS